MKRIIFLMLLLPAAAAAVEQPLTELWPTAEGLRFDYDYTYADALNDVTAAGPAYLEFAGTTIVPGGPAWNLVGDHPDLAVRDDLPPPGLVRWLWLARPDLRPALAAQAAAPKDRSGFWAPYFLHTGYFRGTPERLEMWQDTWLHPTWTYVTAPPLVGTSFTHQLVPELADDIFLHGTITETDAVVITPAGVFTGAVVVRYLVDMGVGEFADETGQVLGQTHGEISGHVAFVPEVGPVEMLEEFVPFVWMDCGDQPCPGNLVEHLGEVVTVQTLVLSETPVSNETLGWGEVKAMFR